MVKVLIVDDEYIMRQGLRYMINWEEEGYEIVGDASNGKEAVELIRELKPDIVISDIVMPQMDGVDFCSAVRSIHPEIQIIILSGYDNFEYVKQTLLNGAVDYILKPTLNQKELLNVLKKAEERLVGTLNTKKEHGIYSEQLLEKYLLGQAEEEELDLLWGEMDSSYYCFYGINFRQGNENGMELAPFLMQKIERELQGIEDIKSYFMMPLGEQALILFGYEMGQRGALRIKIEKINSLLGSLSPLIYGIVSNPFTNIIEARNIYCEDIVRNWDLGFYFPNKRLFLMGSGNERMNLTKCRFDFTKYNRRLFGLAFREAVDCLKEYHDQLMEAKPDVSRMKNQIINLVYLYLDVLQMTDEERDMLSVSFSHSVEEADSVEAYDTAVCRIMEKLQELAQQEGAAMDMRMEKILAYIEENYKEELKLEHLVETFHFSYHYLSTFFNQQMQEGFSEYLNRIRLGKACELLENSSVPVASISEQVGYSGHSYFCRVFKKYMGKTPSEWRRDHNEE